MDFRGLQTCQYVQFSLSVYSFCIYLSREKISIMLCYVPHQNVRREVCIWPQGRGAVFHSCFHGLGESTGWEVVCFNIFYRSSFITFTQFDLKQQHLFRASCWHQPARNLDLSKTAAAERVKWETACLLVRSRAAHEGWHGPAGPWPGQGPGLNPGSLSTPGANRIWSRRGSRWVTVGAQMLATLSKPHSSAWLFKL
jgi:hypothetical protein